jgi:hypothetical protein
VRIVWKDVCSDRTPVRFFSSPRPSVPPVSWPPSPQLETRSRLAARHCGVACLAECARVGLPLPMHLPIKQTPSSVDVHTRALCCLFVLCSDLPLPSAVDFSLTRSPFVPLHALFRMAGCVTGTVRWLVRAFNLFLMALGLAIACYGADLLASSTSGFCVFIEVMGLLLLLTGSLGAFAVVNGKYRAFQYLYDFLLSTRACTRTHTCGLLFMLHSISSLPAPSPTPVLCLCSWSDSVSAVSVDRSVRLRR